MADSPTALEPLVTQAVDDRGAGPGADSPFGGVRPFILYVDDQIVVVDKPPGLPAVPGRTAALQDCAHSRVRGRHADALVVHRLDMATSGLLVFARSLEAQRALGHAFERREVDKRYEAWVAGLPSQDSGSIDLPLAPDWPHRPRQRVDVERGRPARTHWSVLERARDRCRLALQPVTGRTHQLRVHLAQIGHPILGDTLYAPDGVQSMAPRLCLHATRLEMKHPQTGLRVVFESPPPF